MPRWSARARTALIFGVVFGGCAGPPALIRAIRPDDERGYAAAIAEHPGHPRAAYFQWKAALDDKPVDRIASEDAKLSPTRNPFDANQDRIAVSRGAVIYKVHCMQCHGANADGRGPVVLPAHPSKNFHAFSKRFAVTLHRGAPRAWFRKITQGYGPDVPYPSGTSRAMPAFGDKLAKEQVWLAITYLQSLDMYIPGPPESD